MKRIGVTVVKNALANALRGGAMAVVAVLLPHFLTKSLDHSRFSAWVLMLQAAAYANYLDFGLQTAVARYLAQAIERGDSDVRDDLLSTAGVLLCGAAALAALILIVFCVELPQLLPTIPGSLITELRFGVAILGGGSILLLPLSVNTATLVGLHRNELPAFAIGGSGLLGALLVIFYATHHQSLIVMAACVTATNLLGAAVQFAMARHLLPDVQLGWTKVSRRMIQELTRYCGTLVVWSISMIMVTGLDTIIVGHHNFRDVGAYSVAAQLATFVGGINSAICAAFLAPVAVLQERGDLDLIRRMITSGTRLTSFVDFALALGAFIFGFPILRLWVGPVYASQALPFLLILMTANSIRLIGNPLASALMATGQQRQGLFGGFAEGVSNLISSIVGVILLGTIGVAWGTMLGAIVSIAWILAFILPRLEYAVILRRDFVMSGILQPLFCLIPLVGYAAYFTVFGNRTVNVAVLIGALACSGLLVYKWGGWRALRPMRPSSQRYAL